MGLGGNPDKLKFYTEKPCSNKAKTNKQNQTNNNGGDFSPADKYSIKHN